MFDLHETPNPSPLSVGIRILSWLSLMLAAAGIVLVCAGDPFYLALPCSVTGMLIGWHALRRSDDNSHAAAHLGVNLAIFNLFIWLLLIVILPYLFQIDVKSVFNIPNYN
jgi:hypothetical protein